MGMDSRIWETSICILVNPKYVRPYLARISVSDLVWCPGCRRKTCRPSLRPVAVGMKVGRARCRTSSPSTSPKRRRKTTAPSDSDSTSCLVSLHAASSFNFRLGTYWRVRCLHCTFEKIELEVRNLFGLRNVSKTEPHSHHAKSHVVKYLVIAFVWILAQCKDVIPTKSPSSFTKLQPPSLFYAVVSVNLSTRPYLFKKVIGRRGVFSTICVGQF